MFFRFLFLVHSLFFSLFFSDYQEGWQDGFCSGYKAKKGQLVVCPVPPIAPIPKIDCAVGYKCGYDRGFVYGYCVASGGDCEK